MPNGLWDAIYLLGIGPRPRATLAKPLAQQSSYAAKSESKHVLAFHLIAGGSPLVSPSVLLAEKLQVQDDVLARAKVSHKPLACKPNMARWAAQ